MNSKEFVSFVIILFISFVFAPIWLATVHAGCSFVLFVIQLAHINPFLKWNISILKSQICQLNSLHYIFLIRIALQWYSTVRSNRNILNLHSWSFSTRVVPLRPFSVTQLIKYWRLFYFYSLFLLSRHFIFVVYYQWFLINYILVLCLENTSF